MEYAVTVKSPSRRRQVASALAAGVLFAACPATATLPPPTVEPRIMLQAGLNLMQAFNLVESELDLIENYQTTPPACAVEGYGGSVKTLSVTTVSSSSSGSVKRAVMDIYFDKACTKPYLSANATVTLSNSSESFSITETATYFQPNGSTLGTLQASESYHDTGSNVIVSVLGTFTPVGGQPAADVGVVCVGPTSANSKTLKCDTGVAQTFRSLNMSLASVMPVTLTANNPNLSHPSVKIVGTVSNLRTGTAGSLSITQPTSTSLGIGGGGTAYSTTTTSGSEGHFALFPPTPTLWTITDTRHNSKFSFHIVNDTGEAGLASVTSISPPSTLATINVDKSGTGTVKYSDGRSAPIRAWLAAD